MPSADQVPVSNSHSTMLWPMWVVLIAGSTGSALRAVRPFQPSHHAGCPTRSLSRRKCDGFPIAARPRLSSPTPFPVHSIRCGHGPPPHLKQLSYLYRHAGEDTVPITVRFLSKQADGGIPYAVVPLPLPAPLGIVVERDPQRAAERTGKVRNRCIAADDQVHG